MPIFFLGKWDWRYWDCDKPVAYNGMGRCPMESTDHLKTGNLTCKTLKTNPESGILIPKS